MSGLQPGLALNEKQAGRLRPAPRAVWAGPLGRAAMEDTLAVPGSPPTSMGGLGGWPAGLGQRLHEGREGRREGGHGTTLEADGACSVLWPPPTSATSGQGRSQSLSVPTLKMGASVSG